MKNLWRHLVSIVALVACTLSSAGTITYYHNDIAGSPIAATNESGAVLWRESYRPYGERLTNAPASTPNDVWFTSRRQDVDTGLVYMGARYYDPVIGRFMSTDPVGLDEANIHSFNRYAYANNNPYRFVDPDGNASAALSVLARILVPALGLGALNAGRDPKSVEATQEAMRRLLGLSILSENSESGETKSGSGQKTAEDLIGESSKGRETKGRADQYNHAGGRDQRDRDFEALGASDVQDRGNGTKTGTLPDGRPVNIHDSKTDGTPTIEIRSGNREIKIRYPK